MASTASCRKTASSRNFCSHYLHKHLHKLHHNNIYETKTRLFCHPTESSQALFPTNSVSASPLTAFSETYIATLTAAV